MARHDQRALVRRQRLGQLTDARHVEVVGRLVEQEQLGRGLCQQQRGERGPEAFAAGQRRRPPGRRGRRGTGTGPAGRGSRCRSRPARTAPRSPRPTRRRRARRAVAADTAAVRWREPRRSRPAVHPPSSPAGWSCPSRWRRPARPAPGRAPRARGSANRCAARRRAAVSTVRPAGSAVSGRSTRISSSSRTASSAALRRSRASSSFSTCMVRCLPADTWAWRLRAPMTIFGSRLLSHIFWP